MYLLMETKIEKENLKPKKRGMSDTEYANAMLDFERQKRFPETETVLERKPLNHNTMKDVFFIMRKFKPDTAYILNDKFKRIATVKGRNVPIYMKGIYAFSEFEIEVYHYKTERTYIYKYVNGKFAQLQTRTYTVDHAVGLGKYGRGKIWTESRTEIMS